MRDLATLFNSKISGAFPNVQAINASTETSFDGTPWLNLNINDLIIGPVQALFALAGKTPNGIAEVAGTSQILDILRMIAEYKAETIVSATQTENPGELSRLYTCDASLGGFTLTIGNGAFDGQKILVSVKDDAIGLVYVKGTGTLDGNNRRSGIYSGASDLGTPISAGLSMYMEWSATRSQWVPVNAVTADYVSGGQRVLQNSDGLLSISGSGISFASSVSISIVYTITYSLTYRTPLVSLDCLAASLPTSNIGTASSSNSGFVFSCQSIGSDRTGVFEQKGEY